MVTPLPSRYPSVAEIDRNVSVMNNITMSIIDRDFEGAVSLSLVAPATDDAYSG